MGGFSQLNESPAIIFVIGRTHAHFKVTFGPGSCMGVGEGVSSASKSRQRHARFCEILRIRRKIKYHMGGFSHLNESPAVSFVIGRAHAHFKVTLGPGSCMGVREAHRSYTCLNRVLSRSISRIRRKTKHQIGGFCRLNEFPAVYFIVGRANARLKCHWSGGTFSTFDSHVRVMTSALLNCRDEWYRSHASYDGVCRAHHLVWTDI